MNEVRDGPAGAPRQRRRYAGTEEPEAPRSARHHLVRGGHHLHWITLHGLPRVLHTEGTPTAMSAGTVSDAVKSSQAASLESTQR